MIFEISSWIFKKRRRKNSLIFTISKQSILGVFHFGLKTHQNYKNCSKWAKSLYCPIIFNISKQKSTFWHWLFFSDLWHGIAQRRKFFKKNLVANKWNIQIPSFKSWVQNMVSRLHSSRSRTQEPSCVNTKKTRKIIMSWTWTTGRGPPLIITLPFLASPLLKFISSFSCTPPKLWWTKFLIVCII